MRNSPPLRPRDPFPVAVQEALCRRLSERLGLDFTHARLDRSAHPFSGGTPVDVRITSRYVETDFTQAVLAVVHETGHARYEAVCPPPGARQPVGKAAGMATHESQSLSFEMQLARSRPFLGLLAPLLVRHFGDQPAFEPDNLYRLWTRVKPGFIRVDADEVTYPAHVILRYEIERALIEGEIEAEDIPALWDDKMQALLGLDTRGNYQDGCLQDAHWSDGAFGYFPSYTLGAMYAAAQLMAAARRDVADLDAALGHGDLAPLLAWLRAKVHGQGSLLEFNALLSQATGKPLDPGDFQAHLTARYLH